MTTLDEYAQKATFRFCFYGPAKKGKTALAVQLAKIWKIKFLDLEDGIKTAIKPDILPKEYWKNIEVFPLPSRQSAPIGIETILKLIKGKECFICWHHGKVSCPVCKKEKGDVINRLCLDELGKDDCLVIDGTTQLTADCNSAAIAFILKDAENPEQFVLGKDTGGKDFKYPMAVSFMLERIFSYLQTAKFNSVVISHEIMTETLKDTGKVVGAGQNQPSSGQEMIFPSAGSRNFSRQFGRYFDALVHVDVVNGKHRANSKSTHSTSLQTGSRIPDFEDFLGADKQPLPPAQALLKVIETVKGYAKS